MISLTVENYLTAISELAEGDGHRSVTTGRIAEALSVPRAFCHYKKTACGLARGAKPKAVKNKLPVYCDGVESLEDRREPDGAAHSHGIGSGQSNF